MRVFLRPERKDNMLGQDPIVALGKSFEVRGEFVLKLNIGLQWLVAERTQAWLERCGKAFV